MKRRRSGFTLVETLTAAGVGVTVIFTSITLFVSGMAAWYRGEGRISAEENAQIAVRAISRELREAMSVSVDADGNGLTFRKPMGDGAGGFATPIVWDGITRRIELSNGTISLVEGASSRPLADGVILTDPQSNGGTAGYRIFTPGSGSITRSLAVMIVSRKSAAYAEQVTSRAREVVYLRNIPQLVR